MNQDERIQEVERRIQNACDRSGRSRNDIQVIAVTKYVGLAETRRMIDSGFTHIGENRWQDAEEKVKTLVGQAKWHFIGHLQTNKVKDVIGRFHYIHSLDRFNLAKELDKKASLLQTKIRCFIQVNVSGEPSKYGLEPDQLLPFIRQLHEFRHIDPIGLMTMAPFSAASQESRPVFSKLRGLRDEINRLSAWREPLTELSMGMSSDFEVAVEEGATWLRLGSILVKNNE